jgi:hypothetical protein
LDVRYDALINAGALTPNEALRQQAHAVLLNVAPQLRWRYDHLGRP